MRKLSLIVGSLAITACASIPEQLRNESVSGLQVASVQATESCEVQLPVRWGGVITKVETTNEGTFIEVISKELGRNSRPKLTDVTYGRFIALSKNFIEPEIYKAGREITVLGDVAHCVPGKIDKMDYRFPMVKVTALQLWKPRPEGPDVVVFPSLWMHDVWPHPYRYPRPIRRRDKPQHDSTPPVKIDEPVKEKKK